ncbi:DEAD/DEAH box helicase family protein [Paenibacillus sp. Y412MC10]|uniref:DEAD/DEAH box helicase family protein n=1 Tax=Geobacillus sp. (strain Y412MC10) TaxID=481743 RepID=UPI00119DD208|nr:DEAD/DEAH box helicase family protein [Paenibacillus sp. Y412MC10]
MNKYVNTISARLSLRKPQRDSVEILADVLEIIELERHSPSSITEQLAKIQALYPSVTAFEREFPSLCFALATGVGKTRLMGAFISYLYLTKGVHNFFVLAPNLTIYNKLIQDFTPNTPKYVFKGISEFATLPPVIITGENYEDGIGNRRQGSLFNDVHINIFNIAKINTEVRGGKAPRIKRLSEYIGESYFEYLSSLPDLVLLMDESHRYRASAGVKVLNELKPILGLELTATPQVESGNRTVPFQNVIYSYPLHKAMEDGFVKEPAVATRENFNPAQYSEDQLEELKLKDGILVHEETKLELEIYARQNNQQIVKPFVLIVAQDTTHAGKLMDLIQSDDFFGGRYKYKVITVHSNQSGQEKDETVQELMRLEDPCTDTEIVIHVNMLKEGWDVTNLYTIIPLRAANSRTLVEQSIGRGLRLPYGKRTGVKAVDRLTIIAHDRFQDIVDEANNPNSIIRNGVYIGRDVAIEKKQPIKSIPKLEQAVVQQVHSNVMSITGSIANPKPVQRSDVKNVFDLVQKKIQSYEYLPSSKLLANDDLKSKIVEEVRSEYLINQLDLFPEQTNILVEQVVEALVEQTIQHSIDIPRIIIQPVGGLSWGYHEFDMDTSNINLHPVAENILIRNLRTHDKEVIQMKNVEVQEERLEDYLVSALMDYPTISYDEHAELLYKLSNQVVVQLRSYLPDDNAVQNVIQYNRVKLAELIHEQMKDHYHETAISYEVQISKGFTTLQPVHYTTVLSEGVRHFRQPVEDKSRIRSMVFGGFIRCLYPEQKFDSDSERRFAVICENDPTVEKWFKPALGQLKIYYGHNNTYNPDFIVETQTHKYICEIKRESETTDSTVQDKARAVTEWCKYASAHELENGGKSWSYLLIPHTDVQENMTIEGLKSRYLFK